MSPARIRVLAVDDHRLMLEGVVRILRSQPDITVVAMAASGDEAIRLFRAHTPDITLMDLALGDVDGVQAIRAIRAEHKDAKIIVLTMYSGEEDVFRALESGAVGYLLKDAIPDDLISMIRRVHAGERPLSPHIAALFEAGRGQPVLTTREMQVLRLLVEGKRDKEIADILRISSRTAQVHVRSIFGKLNVHDRTAALSTALKRGLLHLP